MCVVSKNSQGLVLVVKNLLVKFFDICLLSLLNRTILLTYLNTIYIFLYICLNAHLCYTVVAVAKIWQPCSRNTTQQIVHL